MALQNLSDRNELRPDVLVESAGSAPGVGLGELAPFPAAELAEPLDLLTDDLEKHAELTDRGRALTAAYLRRLLMVRRQIDAYAASNPSIENAPVVEPLFIVGAPRSGTSVVHRLAASVDGLRAPEGWEFLYPVPPPTGGSVDSDPRVHWAGEELTAPQQISGEIRSIHVYSARMAKECLSAMAFALRSEEFVSRYQVPDYCRWLQVADMTPAYRVHRLVLGILQQQTPPARWALKSPVHLQNLPTLLSTYPDARFIITHREPLPMLSSVSSLIVALRSAFSDSVDPVAVGRYHLELYARSLDELVNHVDSGLIPPDRVVHLRHADIVAGATGQVVGALEALEIPGAAEVRPRLEEIAAEPREDVAGAHQHGPADFGLDEAEVLDAFAAYRTRFLED